MGPDVRNVNADHSNTNIAQENIIVNYPAGLLSLPVFFRKNSSSSFLFIIEKFKRDSRLFQYVMVFLLDYSIYSQLPSGLDRQH